MTDRNCMSYNSTSLPMKSNNYEKTAFERILRETERSYFQNLKVSDFVGSYSLTLLAEKPA